MNIDWHRSVLTRFLFLATLSACGLGGPIREDLPAKNYRLGQLPNSWVELKEKNGADAVFENSRRGTVIAVESLCERYEDSSLENLAKQLMVPFAQREIISQERKMMDGRESLWTSLKGRLDGVPVESRLVVYRKNRCFFDFMLHAKDALTPAEIKDFSDFVEAFRYGGG